MDTLRAKAEHFVSEFDWMKEHGFTLTAYVDKYGTTENPKLGDGGPLIWEADINHYRRVRKDFVDFYNRFGRERADEFIRKAYRLAQEAGEL